MRNLIYILFLFIISEHTKAEVVHQERSLYRNILVEDNYDLRCLKFNVKTSKTNQSCLYKSEPNKLVFNYTKLLFSSLLMLEDSPKSVLIIGLGGGTMSNILHQLYPDARIKNVEIDPAVIKVAREYFDFYENEHVTSKVQDGRIFIKRAGLKKEQYDWIILDAFNGDYIPEHLLTKEFLEETKKLLSPKGVLAANTFSISKLYEHESATYHAVFGDFFNVRNRNNSNRIILTTKMELPNGSTLATRAKALRQQLKPFDVDIIDITTYITSTADDKDWPGDTKILTDQFSPANLLNY
ncbi:fused MFS/spermidine synthase [Thalassotalea sp. 1_MG-2023]|uniref:spermidine synthase n=1 Tax=Thalassotalea sp. 1_MG-2023 TaxID=3062680 RepID=UPI0026E323EB|nr:fused MFS/spermidine synthase [Thalassotalea sp. 1_MG-2023]MDO6425656.1 fused MFS/spermidine synthase [Thalassotalea sp. 1_MG-2023]